MQFETCVNMFCCSERFKGQLAKNMGSTFNKYKQENNKKWSIFTPLWRNKEIAISGALIAGGKYMYFNTNNYI